MQLEAIDDPIINGETGEKWIKINISNIGIRRLNSAIRSYKGDLDDSDEQALLAEIRDDVHTIWTILNPS